MSEKPSNEVKILAVEDDPGDFGLIRLYLRVAGYGVDVEQNTVHWATSVAEAKKQSASNTPDIVLLDLNLPDSSGLATVTEIRNALPGVPIIVLSGNDNKEVAIAALKEGAQDYLVKGHYENDALGKAVLHALVRSRLEARLRLFEVALNSAANAIVITDPDACIQWANPAFTELTGYTLEEAIGHKPSELIKSGKHEQSFYQALWETILSGSIWKGKVVNRRKDGLLYHEELSIAPVMDHRNEITNFVAVKHDITERISAEVRMQELNADLDATLRAIPDMLFELDQNGQYINAWANNPELLVAQQEHLLGRTVSEILPPEAAATVLSALREAGEKGYAHGQIIRLELPDGNKWFELSTSIKATTNDTAKRFIMLSRDITDRYEMAEKVNQLAFYDPLTNLPNRRLMDDRLVQAMSASKRSGRYAALMELDMDNFKPLNDLHGHAAGDLLLIEVANRLRSCVREVDTIARFGGDEFIVILSELDLDKATSAAQAAVVAEKIRTTLAVPYLLKVKNKQGVETIVEHQCTSSIGVVVFVNQENNQDKLIQFADVAMYQAKEAGRNMIRFHEE